MILQTNWQVGEEKMGYVIKNKRTNKYLAKGRKDGGLQDAFVYKRFPTGKMKNLSDDWYVCTVEILLTRDPESDEKCKKQFIEAYNSIWRKNNIIKEMEP